MLIWFTILDYAIMPDQNGNHDNSQTENHVNGDEKPEDEQQQNSESTEEDGNDVVRMGEVMSSEDGHQGRL